MNKKKGLLNIATSLLLIKILPIVSAISSYDISQGPRDLIQILSDFLSPFFEAILNTSSVDEFFFTKILLLILLFVIIKYVIEKSEFLGAQKNKGVVLVIALAISILAIRYIPESDIVNLVLLPYNVTGIAILTLLPFIIFFFFLHKSNMGPEGRRIAWSLYAIIFGVLWYNRYDALAPLGNQIYGWMLAIIILALIFDPRIHQYFELGDFKKFRKESKFWNKIEVKDKMEKLMKAMTSGAIKQEEYDREMKILEDRYAELSK